MKLSKYFFVGLFGLVLSIGNPVFAQGNGHGKGQDKHHGDDDDRDDHYYKHHEKDIRGWYSENEGHLPPGLAKKDHRIARQTSLLIFFPSSLWRIA